jgi:hypothetical protein
MRPRGEWIGTANDLLEALEAQYKQTSSRDRDWPKSAQALSRRLNRMETALAKIGFRISRRRGEDANGTRLIQVKNEGFSDKGGSDPNVPKVVSEASEASEASDTLKKPHNISTLDAGASLTQNIESDAIPSETESRVSPKPLKFKETDTSDATDAQSGIATPFEAKGCRGPSSPPLNGRD